MTHTPGALLLSALLLLAGCTEPPAASADTPAAPPPGQRSLGAASALAEAAPPVELEDTAQHLLASTALGRSYRVIVGLPRGYADSPGRRYPVLFITDTNYAFPVVRSIGRMVGDGGTGLEDFILVGLSYADGDTPQYSRRRDYTPTPNGPRTATVSDMPGLPVVHGGAEPYRLFIRDEVFPFVARHYRADMERRIFAGHSYGALLGTHMLLAEPAMFDKYILSSPSLWYDQRVMFRREDAYARHHDDLPAEVLLTIGGFETLASGSGDSRYNARDDMLRDNAQFAERLRSRGYPGLRLESLVIADEGHLSVYPAAITRGIAWALPPATPL